MPICCSQQRTAAASDQVASFIAFNSSQYQIYRVRAWRSCDPNRLSALRSGPMSDLLLRSGSHIFNTGVPAGTRSNLAGVAAMAGRFKVFPEPVVLMNCGCRHLSCVWIGRPRGAGFFMLVLAAHLVGPVGPNPADESSSTAQP